MNAPSHIIGEDENHWSVLVRCTYVELDVHEIYSVRIIPCMHNRSSIG
jgi:hypothetical protein